MIDFADLDRDRWNPLSDKDKEMIVRYNLACLSDDPGEVVQEVRVCSWSSVFSQESCGCSFGTATCTIPDFEYPDDLEVHNQLVEAGLIEGPLLEADDYRSMDPCIPLGFELLVELMQYKGRKNVYKYKRR